MAAEVISQAGHRVTIYEQKPSVGRKFLMAGKGGLNISHSEPLADFMQRYDQPDWLAPMIDAFTPQDLRDWVHGLGGQTFVGSSGRVFPAEMKAAPLLRAWVARLKTAGVTFCLRHRWLGAGREGLWSFESPTGVIEVQAEAAVLALGGGSWAALGADGAWLPWLAARDVQTADFSPSNGGFLFKFSPFIQALAGEPIKSVVASTIASDGQMVQKSGDLIVTDQGLEGGVIYALSRHLRAGLQTQGKAVLTLDLMPQQTAAQLQAKLSRPMGKQSLTSFWRKQIGLDCIKAALVREQVPRDQWGNSALVVQAIKQISLTAHGMRPLDEAISTAGGVVREAVDDDLMLTVWPGVYCAGEMLDWDAPTGGYLLTACLASGRWAGASVVRWLDTQT